MMYLEGLLLLFLTAMIISSIGFKNYVWFISIGYGLSIAGEGILMLFTNLDKVDIGTIICCILFVVYGFRLSGYLAYRELKSASYNKNMTGEIKDGKTISFGVKVAIWTTCALLYVLQVTPVFYRISNNSPSDIFTYIGIVIMVIGLTLESLVDLQKNKAKKVNPNRFVDTGLYKIVRCPNYLGEMLFWTGVFVSSISTLTGIGQWILVLLGYFGIIYVMFSGARRLEVRQNKRYGNDTEYQKYVKTVPILLPFIPLYSVEKHKWLVA